MLKTRVIPCLLLKGRGLFKTLKFKNPKYIGDPINAVKIFNDKEVDELIFLDITATIDNHEIQFDLIKDITTECFMPFAYGGGIRNTNEVIQVLKLGAEKAIINTHALKPDFIKKASETVGSQSIVVSIDVKKIRREKYSVCTHSGTVNTNIDPLKYAKKVEKMGAGELFINSIDKDGTMEGYDLDLIKSITKNVDIPIIASGGAASLQDFQDAVKISRVSAVAAGSMFVFHGPHRAVLINYPSHKEIKTYLEN